VLGELVPTMAGKWITHPRTCCRNGHNLGPGEALVGDQVCLGHGGGHTTRTRRTRDQTLCGAARPTRTAAPSTGQQRCGPQPPRL